MTKLTRVFLAVAMILAPSLVHADDHSSSEPLNLQEVTTTQFLKLSLEHIKDQGLRVVTFSHFTMPAPTSFPPPTLIQGQTHPCAVDAYAGERLLYQYGFQFATQFFIDNFDVEAIRRGAPSSQVGTHDPAVELLLPDLRASHHMDHLIVHCGDHRLAALNPADVSPELLEPSASPQTQHNTAGASASMKRTIPTRNEEAGGCCQSQKSCQAKWNIRVVEEVPRISPDSWDFTQTYCNIDDGFTLIKQNTPIDDATFRSWLNTVEVAVPSVPECREVYGLYYPKSKKMVICANPKAQENSATCNPGGQVGTAVHEFGHAWHSNSGIEKPWNNAHDTHGPCVSWYSAIPKAQNALAAAEDAAEWFQYTLLNQSHVIDTLNTQKEYLDLRCAAPERQDCPLAGCINYAGLQKLTYMHLSKAMSDSTYQQLVASLKWDACTAQVRSPNPTKTNEPTTVGSQRCPLYGVWKLVPKGTPTVEDTKPTDGYDCQRQPPPAYSKSFKVTSDVYSWNQEDDVANMACSQSPAHEAVYAEDNTSQFIPACIHSTLSWNVMGGAEEGNFVAVTESSYGKNNAQPYHNFTEYPTTWRATYLSGPDVGFWRLEIKTKNFFQLMDTNASAEAKITLNPHEGESQCVWTINAELQREGLDYSEYYQHDNCATNLSGHERISH